MAAYPFSFHRIFTSHMVLQQKKPIGFSGKAEPGTPLSVTFDGKTVKAVAAADGKWQAEFPALNASKEPRTVTLSDGKAAVTLEDVLIGEVWFCSGQSNMEMPICSLDPYFHASDPEALLAAADLPYLRLHNVNENACLNRVPNGDHPVEETTCTGGWQRSSRESAAEFSTLAFLFGQKLQRDLDVPVGLINSSWGGTIIQAWLPLEKLEEIRYERALNLIHRDTSTIPEETLAARREVAAWIRDRFYAIGLKTAPADYPRWTLPEYDDRDWETIRFPYLVKQPCVSVFRAHVMLPEAWAGRDLVLNLGVINDADTTSFNGDEVGSTTIGDGAYWCKLRSYRVPANLVKAGENLIAVRYENHMGCGMVTFSATQGFLALADVPEEKIELGDRFRGRCAFLSDPRETGLRPSPMETDFTADTPNYPTALFNGLVYPYGKMAIGGVIWYQGCSDAGNAHYHELHRALIEAWRAFWHDPELPFLITQLAGYVSGTGPATPLPEDYWRGIPASLWPPFAGIREIQSEMPHLFKNVGLAVTIDAGEQSDIHPHDKSKPALRLALEAERIKYGLDVVSQGPEFARFEVEKEGRVRVFFTHAEGGLKTSDGAVPGAFALGDGERLVWADAVIDGENVVVSSPEIARPTVVRYAFCSYRGDANLINGAGLPAVPFRSDKPDYFAGPCNH